MLKILNIHKKHSIPAKFSCNTCIIKNFPTINQTHHLFILDIPHYIILGANAESTPTFFPHLPQKKKCNSPIVALSTPPPPPCKQTPHVHPLPRHLINTTTSSSSSRQTSPTRLGCTLSKTSREASARDACFYFGGRPRRRRPLCARVKYIHFTHARACGEVAARQIFF